MAAGELGLAAGEFDVAAGELPGETLVVLAWLHADTRARPARVRATAETVAKRATATG
jgi:hypothetical protein